MELEPQHRADMERFEIAMDKFSEAILDLRDHYEDDTLDTLYDSINVVLINIERILK